MKEYDWFFYLIAGLVVAWFIFGGPSRAREGGGGFPLWSAFHLGVGNNTTSTSSASSTSSNSNSNTHTTKTPADQKKEIARELDKATQETEDVARAIEKIKAAEKASPLKDLVDLSRSGAGSSKPAEEYLTITVSKNVSEPGVLVTGWRLVSPITGRSVTIGTGARLAWSGQVNTESDIVALPGEHIVVTSGKSPIGTSFLENRCTGYFEQFHAFKPILRAECPSASEDAVYNPRGGMNDGCFKYLDTLPRCAMPLKTQPAGLSSECYSFIADTVNYNGCVALHRSDAGFYGRDWRVFLNQNEELWKQEREVIELLDQNGKTIDVVTY
jgi:hypothetical protein